MATPREMQLRIRSVKNIGQVTRALEAVSASRVRRAQQLAEETRPYSEHAWDVLRHLSTQPAKDFLHPLLEERETVSEAVALIVTSDRGLAGAYNTNVLRFAFDKMAALDIPIRYVSVGRKGRDTLARRGENIIAEFSDLPAEPSFADVSAIGRLVINEFLDGKVDEVYLVYTNYINLLTQQPTLKKLLPFEVEQEDEYIGTGATRVATEGPEATYIYEPSAEELIDVIVPRLSALQVYQGMLESLASEHAARMVAMRNATENAKELASLLQLEYNKARQQAITGEMLDIAGGVEAQAA